MHKKYVIALYIRLSVEDFKTESLSIPNQKLILREKAMSLPEWDDGEVLEFVDNGHTGTNFERPAVQELLTMVQAGKIDCIIVKDLSRFGRNSIETGYFIERVFPLYHTRFISVSDDFDTANFKGDTGGIKGKTIIMCPGHTASGAAGRSCGCWRTSGISAPM